MNPEIKAQWLEDLRSGNFRKGRGVLHRVRDASDGTKIHEFCCLGVLCEQAVAAGVVERHGSPDNGGAYSYGADSDATYLPREVREWAGIDTHSPVVMTGEYRGDHVATLNDDHYDDFGPIADAIEGDDHFGERQTEAA